MSDLKDMALSKIDFLDKMHASYANGDKETLGSLMKSILSEHKDFQRLASDASRSSPELELPEADMSLDYIPEGFNLESIPNSALADLFDPDVFDTMADHLRGLIPTLDNTHLALHSLKKHRHLKEEEDDMAFHFESESSGSRTRYSSYGTKDQFKNNSHPNMQRIFNPRGFQNSQMIKSMKRRFKAVSHKQFHLPRHLKNHINTGGDERREQRRRRLEGDEDCQLSCPFDNTPCNCNRLRACVNQLQPYDYAVLFVGAGYIDEEGTFRIDTEELNFFDAENQLPEKIAYISELAASNKEEDCDKLLGQFHTACPDFICSSSNHESFHLTIDEICDAVNTPTLLKIQDIGEAYDGFSNLGGGPFLDLDMNDDIIQWFTSQYTPWGISCGKENDGKDIGRYVKCRVEWLDILPCSDDSTNCYGVNESCRTGCVNKLEVKLKEIEAAWRATVEPGSGKSML